ncbi:MAG: hypothetical protein IPK56_05415 [Elusimicrobia bacterium]|nr:hypothetical protein [Elusimicrobiota bacterium]MBK9056641.1 hypothetical protein [Elusimicrobiota bacterium]
MMKSRRWSGIVLWAAVVAVPVAAKMSLAVRFPDVVLENVAPGLVLNLRQAKGVPYVVINNSDTAVDIQVDVELPGPQRINPKEGYEPAPDAGWIRVVPNRFRLGPGEVGTAEVILSVPNDPALQGRHLQINLHARTLTTGQLALAVNHYVRFSVNAMGPTALAKERDRVALGRLDLDMTPSLRLDKVPVGRPINIKDMYGAAVKIANKGNEAVRLKLVSAKLQNSLREPGWDEPKDPGWLTVRPDTLKLKPNRIAEARLSLNIPDAPDNRGRKFLFLLTGELADLGIPLQYTTRVYVTTE